MNEIILKCENLHKYFPLPAEGELKVLRGLDLEIVSQSSTGIIGVSGSGKSTLLHILGSLDSPTKGKIFYEEKEMNKMSDEKLSNLRNAHFGFIFQFHYLISELTVIENVMLPYFIKTNRQNNGYAEKLLSDVGIFERKDYYPNQLSGGELQRAAIARALMNKPKIIFADEPTGELDNENAGKVFELLLNMVNKYKSSLIFVTHNNNFAKDLQKTYRLYLGQLKKI